MDRAATPLRRHSRPPTARRWSRAPSRSEARPGWVVADPLQARVELLEPDRERERSQHSTLVSDQRGAAPAGRHRRADDAHPSRVDPDEPPGVPLLCDDLAGKDRELVGVERERDRREHPMAAEREREKLVVGESDPQQLVRPGRARCCAACSAAGSGGFVRRSGRRRRTGRTGRARKRCRRCPPPLGSARSRLRVGSG